MQNLPHIAVIGAGVSGLTCGLWLRKAGFPVSVFSKDAHESLVSRKAAAIWLPYQAHPQELIEKLSLETFNDFKALSQKYPQAGVQMVKVPMLFRKPKAAEDYGILSEIPARPLSAAERPQGFASGWEIRVPFIDTSIYMPFLLQRFQELGGTTIQRHLTEVAELRDFPLVVNCCGLGGIDLLGDDQLFPIRGQIVRVAKPATPVYLIDESDEGYPGYIFSRQHDCVVGGSAQPGQWGQTPDLALRKSILQRCAAMLPSISQAAIIADDVGLRPGRSQLRLGADTTHPADHPSVFHNYGHGGSGFTISWGCARRAVAWACRLSKRPVDQEMPFT